MVGHIVRFTGSHHDAHGGGDLPMNHNLIYIQFNGEMKKVGEPRISADRRNFVITWKGMDWSGFRTLAECEAQFDELNKKSNYDYAVVEK